MRKREGRRMRKGEVRGWGKRIRYRSQRLFLPLQTIILPSFLLFRTFLIINSCSECLQKSTTFPFPCTVLIMALTESITHLLYSVYLTIFGPWSLFPAYPDYLVLLVFSSQNHLYYYSYLIISKVEARLQEEK